ncbi:MAG: NINE protein [Cyanobacteria bacterium CRU_2_1]|nr:NINE protein [Cyanobacteria bacterium RU_5_0]NJR60146.1 NINE protein [Cyanobacteria bacterium CRU_2_1]
MSKSKDRRIAAILAFAGAVPLLPSGLHKFYLGQPQWGIVYLLLSLTPIPKVASALEGLWYLFQEREEFDQHFNFPNSLVAASSIAPSSPNSPVVHPQHIGAIADVLRELDQLRQDGLISEYEFEQKRRQLLDQIG